MYKDLKPKEFIFTDRELEEEKYVDASSYIKENDERLEIAVSIEYILDYAIDKYWYDNGFAKKCFELLEKGYHLSKWQKMRIHNAYTLARSLTDREKTPEIKSEEDKAPTG